jgi:hypothetical protein
MEEVEDLDRLTPFWGLGLLGAPQNLGRIMKRINYVRPDPLKVGKKLNITERERYSLELQRLEAELLELKKQLRLEADFKMWLGYMRCCVRQRPDWLPQFEEEILSKIPEEWELMLPFANTPRTHPKSQPLELAK